METDSRAVRKARIVWFVVVVAAPLCCAVALVLAMQGGGPVIDWEGMMGKPAPAMGFGVLGAYAFVAPLVLIVLRAFVVGPAGGGAGPMDAQQQDEGAALQTWLRRQVLFFALADTLPVLAFFQVLVWGSMPLRWLVSAEYVLVMLFCFPRLPAGLSGGP